jgi:prophage antirepressor-like protein
MGTTQQKNTIGIQIFNFQNSAEIRVELINGLPWFVAKDVCYALGLEHTTNAISKLDEDERLNVKLLHSGQMRTYLIINESGLYALVMRSTKPQAKAFRRWVTNEVLPAIRKTGGYGVPTAGYVSKAEWESSKQATALQQQIIIQLRSLLEQAQSSIATYYRLYQTADEYASKLYDRVIDRLQQK